MRLTKRDFAIWLKQVDPPDTPAGDFISDARRDTRFPKHVTSFRELRKYLDEYVGSDDVLDAARVAWRAFKRWQRKRAKA